MIKVTNKYTKIPLINGVYKHYTGKNYRVLNICRHSETLEELVCYRALYGDFDIWVRPLQMFCEIITFQGEDIPRFKYLPDGDE